MSERQILDAIAILANAIGVASGTRTRRQEERDRKSLALREQIDALQESIEILQRVADLKRRQTVSLHKHIAWMTRGEVTLWRARASRTLESHPEYFGLAERASRYDRDIVIAGTKLDALHVALGEYRSRISTMEEKASKLRKQLSSL